MDLRATKSSISLICAGGNAPGKDDVARAANASVAAFSSAKSLSDLAICRLPVAEVQNVPVLALVNDRWIVYRNRLLVAVVIGHGDIEIEPVTGRQQ